MTRLKDDACLVCGLAHAGPCDPKRLKRIDAGRKSHEELGREERPGLSRRLADGFDLLDDGDVEYESEPKA